MARYPIGIDLGTTNSALAFLDLDRLGRGQAPGRRDVQTFPVPQLVGPGEMGQRPLLPSFLYLPGPHDLPPGATALSWEPNAAAAVDRGRHPGFAWAAGSPGGPGQLQLRRSACAHTYPGLRAV